MRARSRKGSGTLLMTRPRRSIERSSSASSPARGRTCARNGSASSPKWCRSVPAAPRGSRWFLRSALLEFHEVAGGEELEAGAAEAREGARDGDRDPREHAVERREHDFEVIAGDIGDCPSACSREFSYAPFRVFAVPDRIRAPPDHGLERAPGHPERSEEDAIPHAPRRGAIGEGNNGGAARLEHAFGVAA